MQKLNFNPEIFKAYDIRGTYGVDFNEQFAADLGRAVAGYLEAGELVVARDLRESSDLLANKLVEGVEAAGGTVVNLGTATTPFFYWATRWLRAAGGVMITASHNSAAANGFKIVDRDGVNIGEENGLGEIEKLLRSDLKAGIPRSNLGKGNLGESVSSSVLAKQYADFIIKASRLKPGRVKVAFAVKPNPLVEKELAPILQALALEPNSTDSEVTFEFDPDGDRLYVYDHSGVKIPSDFIFGLLAKEQSGFWTGPTVVNDHRFSRAVIEDCRKYGVKFNPTRVGHTFIKTAMRAKRADLGAELSGHFYFSATGGSESSVLAMLKVLKLLEKYNRPIDELVKPFKKYFRTETVISNDKLPISNQIPTFAKASAGRQNLNFKAVAERLREKFTGGEVSELDGLTIDFWQSAGPAKSPSDRGAGWWFNLRPSNTEPVWRLIIEAKTQVLLDQKSLELFTLIKNC